MYMKESLKSKQLATREKAVCVVTTDLYCTADRMTYKLSYQIKSLREQPSHHALNPPFKGFELMNHLKMIVLS